MPFFDKNAQEGKVEKQCKSVIFGVMLYCLNEYIKFY